jgi:hypothetical protein
VDYNRTGNVAGDTAQKTFFSVAEIKEETELVNHTEGHFNPCVKGNIKTAVPRFFCKNLR